MAAMDEEITALEEIDNKINEITDSYERYLEVGGNTETFNNLLRETAKELGVIGYEQLIAAKNYDELIKKIKQARIEKLKTDVSSGGTLTEGKTAAEEDATKIAKKFKNNIRVNTGQSFKGKISLDGYEHFESNVNGK